MAMLENQLKQPRLITLCRSESCWWRFRASLLGNCRRHSRQAIFFQSVSLSSLSSPSMTSSGSLSPLYAATSPTCSTAQRVKLTIEHNLTCFVVMYGASGTFDEELSSSVALEASVTSLSSAPGCSHAKNTQTMHYDKTIKRDNHHLSAISFHTFFSKSVKPASAAAASFLSSWLKVWKLLLKFSFCLFRLLAQRSMSFAIWHTNILFSISGGLK